MGKIFKSKGQSHWDISISLLKISSKQFGSHHTEERWDGKYS